MTDSGNSARPDALATDEKGALIFPCRYPVKIMTRTEAQALDKVLTAIGELGATLDRDRVHVRSSRNGRFQSITVEVEARSRQQLEHIYAAVRALDVVVMTL